MFLQPKTAGESHVTKQYPTGFLLSDCQGEGLYHYQSFLIFFFFTVSQLFGKGLRVSPTLFKHFDAFFILWLPSCLVCLAT